MLLCSRSIAYPITHWLLCTLVFHLDICRALGLKSLHAQSHLEGCHKSKCLQDVVGINKTEMVIPAPTPCAKSKEKYSVVVTEDKRGPSLSQCTQYLPVFLENWDHFGKMLYHCTLPVLLTTHWKVSQKLLKPNRNPRKGDKFPGYQNERKTTFLHKCWNLTSRRLLTVLINYMTLQTKSSSCTPFLCMCCGICKSQGWNLVPKTELYTVL